MQKNFVRGKETLSTRGTP